MECPECSRRLGNKNECACGWRARPIEGETRECSRCEKTRRVEVVGMPSTYACEHCGAISVHFCEQCGSRSVSTATAGGRRLCPSCRLVAIRMEASVASDLCVICGVPVSVHIAEFRERCQRLEAQMTGKAVPEEWRSRPSVLERMGVHKPRKAVARRLEQDRG